MHIAAWLNSEWLRKASYAAAIAACVMAGRRELATTGPARVQLWPRFWFAAAGVLGLLLVGRVTGLGSSAYELGRREAITGGWYWSRRRLQGAAILGLGAAGLVGVVVIARVMEDRIRRYLPTLVCLVGLAGFAAARVVSLHQVDTILYRRPIFGARIASLLEIFLTAGIAAMAGHMTRSQEDGDDLRQQGRKSESV